MQPLLVHYCRSCTYNTPTPFTASVFSQNVSCSHCGAVAPGVNVRGKLEEESSMQQDELARLFQANLNLSQRPTHSIPTPQPDEQNTQQDPVQQQQPAAEKTIVYASQHYTHSHHVAPTRHIAPLPEVKKTPIDTSRLGEIFLRNSIDPSLLFPSQIDLFQNADDDQRLRLLELWRISPPQGRQGYPDGVDYNMSRQLYDWPPTSLAQEEAMAKLRYEKAMEESVQSEAINNHQQELDQSMSGLDVAAVQETRNLLTSSPDTQNAEPYVVSGYDMLARREYEESAKQAPSLLQETSRYNQATDPVYNNTGAGNGLWEKHVGSMLDMENQYGAFAHARDYDVRPIYADEEMVM